MSKKKKTIEELLEEALVPEAEQPYEIPDNWIWSNAGAVSKVLRGVSYKKHQVEVQKNDNNLLVLRGGNIQDGTILNQGDNVYVSNELVKEEQRLQKNDVVIVSSTGSSKVIGKAASVINEFVGESFGAFLTTIRPSKKIDSRYFGLYYQTANYRNVISSLAKGSNINNIKKEHLDSLSFPQPPLDEQKRIVEKVESLLGKVEEAKQLIDEAKETFELRRAAILDKAFRGELTKKWRTVNNCTETPETILKKIQEKNESISKKLDRSVINETIPEVKIPPTWKWVQFAEVIDDLTDYHANGSYKVLKEHVELLDKPDYACMIRATNFEQNNFSDLMKYITEPAYNFLSKSKLYGGEILISKIGNTGSVYLMPNLNKPCSLAMNLFALRISGFVDNEFIYYYLKSPVGSGFINKYIRGVTTTSIDKKSVRSVWIPLPPLEEQIEIKRLVRRINDRHSGEQKLVETAEASIEDLKQSVLSKAFKGEFGTNDPSEENAIELLKEVLQEQVK
ncbi:MULTISPECIES: restriction endonuclease subunit S [Bacillus amyloliquefaciens group]|uniref:restriction endonuclease subunit S n=1 Tax=Bacillus amyloliquefaciens group TaxID=1938374 RepID=UPI00058F63C9|nr:MULTISPECIES: restriction endonuclease subunit S [Bacillus amyloliquefaciens group]KMO09454.1 hypothetical protein TH57_01215 [Bacillus amyloliquefaciens]MDE5153618.1 restriction endonuclease subunit S [Bacillus amyloliquefaciens]QTG84070.1 restriction endonuclease subunit S [Bacillus amyloliquefaciens]RBZ01347.1 hypothetical protein DSD26_03585 [Bacillus velezensis]UUI51754.1 restriction endonuclease subunit S [Bacillus velezensis]